ncbi:hypothetical protein Tco_0437786 [Tanacetum coccineum]
MEAGTTTTTLTARFPILNLGDYDLWLMRIEQYFLMTDYSLWEVIKNGNKVLKKTVGDVEQVYEHTSAKEKMDMKNEMKARGTMLMAIPNKDHLKFHSYNDAKLLMETIEKRLQKLISLLEIQGEVITQEDINLKLLRSLPSKWKTHALIWRNKEERETISLDDLYNNLKIYEPELEGSLSTCQNLQNVAFMSSNSTNSNCNNSTNKANNTAHGVSAAHTQCNPTSGDNLSDAMICAFLAMESPTENALVAQDRIGGYDWSYQAEEEYPTNFALMEHTSSGSSSSSDSEVDSYSKSCLESVEARLAHYKKNEAVFEESINVLNLEVKLRDNALVENKKKLEKAEKERDELKLTLEKFQNSSKSLNNLLESQVIDKFKTGLGYNAASSTAASPAVESFVNSSEMLENQEYNKSKSDKGYHAVPPPYTGNFIPFKLDLTFMDEIVESENIDVITIVTPSNGKKVESNHESAGVKSNGDAVEPKTVRKNSFRPPVIEDWNSNDESEVEIIPKDKTVSSSTKKIKFVKSAREKVEKVETSKQNNHYPRGNQRNWNNLMSQTLGMWNNSSRVNHKNFANKMTHPYSNRRFVPQAVLTRSGKINTAGVSVNTAVRLVNTVGSKPTVNPPKPISNAYKKRYSQVTMPFNKYSANKNNNFNKKVNNVRVKDTTARDRAVVSENKGKREKGLMLLRPQHAGFGKPKTVGNPQQKEYKEKGVIDSGCSRHITGNKCYLTEYEVYDGGFVSFRDGKGCFKKCKIGPLIIFIKDIEKSMLTNPEAYTSFKTKLEKLPWNVVVIALHAQMDNRKEKSHPGGLLFTKFGSSLTTLLDSFQDSYSRLHDKSKETPKTGKQLSRLFPNKVTIQTPQEGVAIEIGEAVVSLERAS